MHKCCKGNCGEIKLNYNCPISKNKDYKFITNCKDCHAFEGITDCYFNSDKKCAVYDYKNNFIMSRFMRVE